MCRYYRYDRSSRVELSMTDCNSLSELSYAQSEDRPPSQATVTVFKKHLVSKVPHLEKDREGSTVGQV